MSSTTSTVISSGPLLPVLLPMLVLCCAYQVATVTLEIYHQAPAFSIENLTQKSDSKIRSMVKLLAVFIIGIYTTFTANLACDQQHDALLIEHQQVSHIDEQNLSMPSSRPEVLKFPIPHPQRSPDAKSQRLAKEQRILKESTKEQDSSAKDPESREGRMVAEEAELAEHQKALSSRKRSVIASEIGLTAIKEKLPKGESSQIEEVTGAASSAGISDSENSPTISSFNTSVCDTDQETAAEEVVKDDEQVWGANASESADSKTKAKDDKVPTSSDQLPPSAQFFNPQLLDAAVPSLPEPLTPRADEVDDSSSTELLSEVASSEVPRNTEPELHKVKEDQEQPLGISSTNIPRDIVQGEPIRKIAVPKSRRSPFSASPDKSAAIQTSSSSDAPQEPKKGKDPEKRRAEKERKKQLNKVKKAAARASKIISESLENASEASFDFTQLSLDSQQTAESKEEEKRRKERQRKKKQYQRKKAALAVSSEGTLLRSFIK